MYGEENVAKIFIPPSFVSFQSWHSLSNDLVRQKRTPFKVLPQEILNQIGSDLFMTFIPSLNIRTLLQTFSIMSTISIKTLNLVWRKKVMWN